MSVSPVEELRWLEYGQRLAARRRNIAAPPRGLHRREAPRRRSRRAGPRRWQGKPARWRAGRAADIVTLDASHPLLAGKTDDAILDTYVFAGNANPVRDVMVGGTWVVRDGRHPEEEAIGRAFVRTMERLVV